MNIRTRLDQQLDDFGVAIRGGPHQGGLSAAFLRVHIRAALEQRLHWAGLAGARRRHQHRFAAAQRGVRIRAVFEEQFDHRRIPVLAGERQRRDTITIRRRHVAPWRRRAALAVSRSSR